jgi:leucyl/phenylalanyl-tRNA---protein transferase
VTIFLPRLGRDAAAPFPPVTQALEDPNGLLAMGGDLHPERLTRAYAQGIFPWFSDGQPILWWSPDPRMVLPPVELHVSRSLRRFLRQCGWRVSTNAAFAEVVSACARAPRRGQHGTWITREMQDAYLALHRLGRAHSVEVWVGDQLVGAIYGVGFGRMFFGESMVSLHPGGSKVAIAALCAALRALDVQLLDGQVESDHLASLGFRVWPRSRFVAACAEHANPHAALDLAAVDPALYQPAALATAS